MRDGPRILVVEDDENLRLALADNLEEQGYAVVSAPDAATARRIRNEETELDLIILDIMLPDSDGYTLCRELRADGERVLILMLTARTLEEDIVRGFDAGADDYVAKPFRIAELLARVRALLRRGGDAMSSDNEMFGSYTIDTVARVVRHRNGRTVELTRTEYDLLVHFVRHAGRALHRQRILDAVWGEDLMVDSRTVDNFVSSLKKKLAWAPDEGWRITTIRGVGYRFEMEPTADGSEKS